MWFSIPGVRRTGVHKRCPRSCMAASSVFLLSPFCSLKTSRICHPKTRHFGILITVNTMGSEKQQMQRDMFSDLLGAQLSYTHLLSQEFSPNREDADITGETRIDTTVRLCHKLSYTSWASQVAPAECAAVHGVITRHNFVFW